MSTRFASSKNAIAECDICGFRYKLRELRSLVKKGKVTGLKACPTCWDSDHPQLKLGMYPVDDPQAIRDPRPDFAGYAQSRAIIYSGSEFEKLTFVGTGFIGQVIVVTS
tara:strand:+ start:231 stop:557 length:327 start_codon:yes stop_codon:yes gene_type:complete